MDKTNNKEATIANRILLAGASVLIFSVLWLYVLDLLKSNDFVGPYIKLLIGLVAISVAVTDYFYVKKSKRQ